MVFINLEKKNSNMFNFFYTCFPGKVSSYYTDSASKQHYDVCHVLFVLNKTKYQMLKYSLKKSVQIKWNVHVALILFRSLLFEDRVFVCFFLLQSVKSKDSNFRWMWMKCALYNLTCQMKSVSILQEYKTNYACYTFDLAWSVCASGINSLSKKNSLLLEFGNVEHHTLFLISDWDWPREVETTRYQK